MIVCHAGHGAVPPVNCASLTWSYCNCRCRCGHLICTQLWAIRKVQGSFRSDSSKRQSRSIIAACCQCLTKCDLPLVVAHYVPMQDITAALPVSGASSHQVPISNLQGYAEKLQQIVAATVTASATSSPAGAGPAPSAAAEPSSSGPCMPAGSAPSSTSDAAGRWQKAAVAATGITLPQQRAQQLASAFGALLSDSVRSEEKQVARWCSVLVLSRQLGRSIAGLNDSVNDLLAKLPWVQAG